MQTPTKSERKLMLSHLTSQVNINWTIELDRHTSLGITTTSTGCSMTLSVLPACSRLNQYF
jgi:hypothetical protein